MVNNNTLDIRKYRSDNSLIYSGRDLGDKAREELGITVKDKVRNTM